MDRLTRKDENGNWYVGEDFCYDSWAVPKKFCGDAIDRLAHYEDLEEQGRLVVLPCTVGDTVYEVQQIRKRVQPLEIISVYIGRMGELFFNWELKDGIGIYQNVKGFGLSQIGKTVFLTHAEAEAALAAASGKEG